MEWKIVKSDSEEHSSLREERLGHSNIRELDLLSEEFALLVRKHTPSFGSKPAEWLRCLPTEVFFYYGRGSTSFGRAAQSKDERRGRTYLLHTALVLLWMRWSKEGARKRLVKNVKKGVRRAARLTCLERYRRGGVLAEYDSEDWFSASSDRWSVLIKPGSVSIGKVDSPSLRDTLETDQPVEITTDELARLSRQRAIPRQSNLPPMQ